MMYALIKNAHITFALISISLFIIRSYWSVTQSPRLKQTWVRVMPHVNDTLLLGCAVYLMLLSQQYPFANNWLSAKFIALLAYIGCGTVAIKRGETVRIRLFFAMFSVTIFAYIFSVAITRSPSL